MVAEKSPFFIEEGAKWRRLDALRRHFAVENDVHIAVADAAGVLCAGACCARSCGGRGDPVRRFALQEALRWGEPTVALCPRGRLLWAAPILENQDLRGGLVASVTEARVFPDDSGVAAFNVRAAGRTLAEALERANLTNAALLADRRRLYRREQERAHLLHDLKGPQPRDVRAAYLSEEPALISAIRAKDRVQARGSMNRVLGAVYHAGRGNLPLLKSLLLELVVSMCRTAAEMGADPETVLGANYAGVAELADLPDEESLWRWLVEILESLMDCLARHRRQPAAVVGTAMEYMRQHLHEPIGRDDVAGACHLSPCHFSRVFRAETGQRFSDALNRMRVERATELLAAAEMPLAQIALRCGFSGQSYFTKVFRRHVGAPPGQYRRGRLQEE